MPQLTPAKLALALAAFALIPAPQCFADTINLGFMVFDQGQDTAAFDISNNTGALASPFPDPSFPSVTPVPFNDVTLFVNFADGTSEEFDSYSGQQEPDFTTKPISSAILTGTFGATQLTLNDGSTVTIDPTLTAIVTGTDPMGNLESGDFGLISASATAVAAAPEPSLLAPLLGLAILGLCVLGRLERLPLK